MKVCPHCKQRYPHESSFCFVDGTTLEALPDARLGTVIAGRYVLEQVLGEGGMATVYGARHKLVDRPKSVAVKILHGEVTREPTVRERFRREAQHAQRLSHSGIIEVYEHGETDEGTAFLVMEQLEGQSLAQVMAAGRTSIGRTLKLGAQMVRALARAHDFEVIHRDLKPENVFVLAGDRIKLLDFGIARSMQDSRLTSVGEIFGTPEYMAPEQGTSTEAGTSADIYALGVIFFEMIVGALPYDAPNAPTMLVKHMSEPVPHVRDRLKDVPDALDELIYSMMAKSPADRPIDAQSVGTQLARIAEDLGVELPAEQEIEAPPVSRQLRSGEGDLWARRSKLFAAMLQKAFPGAPPAEMTRMLTEVATKVEEVARLRTSAFDEEQKLEIVESEGREGRGRFGQAMDTLTADVSRIREEAKRLRSGASPYSDTNLEFSTRLRGAHKQAVFWEGRCAFTEPHAELAKAYRELASIVDEWQASRDRERQAEKQAQDLEAQLSDLDYQIKELRSGLDSLGRDVEERRAESRSSIGEMGTRAELLEADLLSIATRFCAPLRAKPELGSLFKDLEKAS